MVVRGANRSLRADRERRCARILASASPLVVDDLPWDDRGPAISDEVIDTLIYMRDVEGFTDRDLVGLGGHRTTLADPLIAPFLKIWRSEEAGHTAALERFLDWYAEGHGVDIPPRQAPPPSTVGWHERLLAQVGGPVGTTVAAAHMTWGAANELLTVNGYRLLADRCRHPLLAELMGRIAAQEARHYSFYLLQAEWRLAESRLARVALRYVLSHAWTPVGVGDGYKSPAEFGRVLSYLSAGEDGRRVMSRMDNRFSALPGLEGLRIFRDAASLMAAT